METPEMIAALTQRVDTLEAALKAVMQKLSERKPRTATAKELTDEEKEAQRLKINEASRLSKLKQRAKAAGFDDINAYQAHMATKRNKLVGLLVQAADQTPEPEAIPASRTVVEFDDVVADAPTETEGSQERGDDGIDYLFDEQGNVSDLADLPSPQEQREAKKARAKKSK